MEIETLKQTKNGYLINDSIFVPDDIGNSDYQAIQKWITEGGIVEEYGPLPDLKAEKIAQCQGYLASTDWQIIRLSDPTSGEALKEGVAANRASARSLQDEITDCTTLEELNAITVTFE